MNIQKVVDLLNHELSINQNAIEDVLNFKTEYKAENEHLSKLIVSEDNEGKLSLSSLGLINTVLNELLGKRVVAVYDDQSGKLLRFEIYKPNTTSSAFWSDGLNHE